MRTTVTAMAIICVLIAAPVQAETPKAGDVALFFTDLTSGNSTIAGSGAANRAGAVALQPTYNIGVFVSENVMPYGGVTVQTVDDTATLIRGGSRFYFPLGSGDLRTFGDAELSILSSDGGDATGIGGFFGVEYHFARQFSVSGRVGLRTLDPENGDTITRFGATDLSVNFYF